MEGVLDARGSRLDGELMKKIGANFLKSYGPISSFLVAGIFLELLIRLFEL